MADRRETTAAVKDRARALGFSAVGIADAQDRGEDAVRLEQWLDRGYAASMRWMERRKAERGDPSLVLPGIRSIIVVSMNYYHSTPVPDGGPKISRYARGGDYHEVMGQRMVAFVHWLGEAFPGTNSKWYVDTGPVMEKPWAQRAGIGWIGKHTTLISPDEGSWVFLGVILTTADLVADASAVDRCGSCTACIEACPTGAIVEPYVLDAGRCIAYLTIEHRGPFDPDREGALDGWIFGCDVCQDVCPWNAKRAHPTAEAAFAPRGVTAAPDAEDLLGIDEQRFADLFAGTPVLRATAAGLKRNCIAYQRGLRTP